MRNLSLIGAAIALAVAGASFAGGQGQGQGKAKKGASSTSQTVNTVTRQLTGTGGAGNLLSVGQILPAGFSNFTSLSALPAPVRGLLPQGMNYVMQGNSVAAVDPTSRIVRQIIPIPR